MRKFLTKDSAAGTFETVDHCCHTSSRVRCDKQMYVVWHHFHSLDEHAVLLCRGIQNVLEPLFHFTDKNFEAILRAEHDVVRQVEDGSGVLDVTTVFWRLKSYVISLPCSYLFFKYLYALTCRLKSALRRAVTYRFSVSCLPTQDLVAREAKRPFAEMSCLRKLVTRALAHTAHPDRKAGFRGSDSCSLSRVSTGRRSRADHRRRA